MYPMNGSHAAKKYVNDYLSLDMPKRLNEYRNGWGISNAVLPSPEQYISYEPLSIDRWPSIITVVLSTNALERIGFENNNPIYRVQYSMRTYSWVRDDGSELCTIQRDRLTTVVRSALLDYPCLKAFDSRFNFRILIDESTIREEFSDITLLKGDRVMSGSYVAYNLEIDEVVERTPLGEVATIELEAESVISGNIPFAPVQ